MEDDDEEEEEREGCPDDEDGAGEDEGNDDDEDGDEETGGTGRGSQTGGTGRGSQDAPLSISNGDGARRLGKYLDSPDGAPTKRRLHSVPPPFKLQWLKFKLTIVVFIRTLVVNMKRRNSLL
jgi:hypothetical protein